MTENVFEMKPGIRIDPNSWNNPELHYLAAIMRHAARFFTSGWRSRIGDPSGLIGVRPLAVRRVWG
jgi:hypothetical protein